MIGAAAMAVGGEGSVAAAFVAVGMGVAVVSRCVPLLTGAVVGADVDVVAAVVCPCCACRVDSDTVKVGTTRPVVTGLLVSSGAEPPQADNRKTQTLNHKR